ncbi:hypothetical protein BTO06_05500 [Tenacibaculum sp. SZ-18]|uniref:lipocalin family protein n=1 Tax=Tenacibaculum sp. SZ-18 TaxID=754423 RepID=UPI000C2D543F|nr:lipocalin family protein [Tenacibaculum sp. SZ-18]AUC14626.1 hypothetical protein BTO06_05500 [Tenacibaculum sp. SZ-18]
MKKFILISFALISFISCSSNSSSDGGDTTDPGQTLDPIIGVWNLSKENGFDVNSCSAQSRYIFTNDGKFTFTQHSTINNECTLDSQNSYNGEWTNNDDGTYYIKRHGFTSGTDAPISFTNENQDMIIGKFTWAKQ